MTFRPAAIAQVVQIGIAAFVFAAILCAAAPVSAADPDTRIGKDDLAQRLHLAGRQRMLTQRMIKAVCLALFEVDTQAQSEAAYLAAVEFEDRLEELRFGVEGGLHAERNPKALAALERVAKVSGGLTRSIKQLASGDQHTELMRLVLDRNVPVLKDMDKAVGQMARQKSAVLSARTARTLNEAGRLRMLSQQIAKNTCLVTVGMKRTKSSVALKHEVTYFDGVIRAMTAFETPSHFDPAPSFEIKRILQEVAQVWTLLKPALDDVVAGELPTHESLRDINLQAEKLLTGMDRAVTLWAQHTP